MTTPPGAPDGKMMDAARLAAERARRLREEPEPSVASRLGQIGVLGWTIVAPILLGVVIGRWLDWSSEDRHFLHRSADHAWRGGGLVDRLALDAPAMTPVLVAAFAAGVRPLTSAAPGARVRPNRPRRREWLRR